jgi:[ribosomal protein S5]-alanine N-acetyltransferase
MMFETQRLILKPITNNDINKLHEILSDAYVRRYLCDNEIWSLEKVAEMLAENARLFAEEKVGMWFIETKSDREIIGFVCLWYFFGEPQPQLGYALLPTATKKGYATEAATKILEYSFNELGFNYLIASCDRPNLESQKVAERLGMKQVETRIMNESPNYPTVFFRLDKS